MRRDPTSFHSRSLPSRQAALQRWLLAVWLLLLAVITPAMPTPVARAADPDTVGGLQLWLDASDPDADGNAGNNPANGAALTVWHDKSGGDRDATVAAGKNSGTYRTSGGTDFNNAPVVEFARSSGLLGSIYQVAGVDIRAATMEDVTIFTVYKVGAGVQPHTAIWGADNANWDRFFYPRHTGFGDFTDDGVAGLGPVQSGAVVADSGQVGIVRLLTAVYDGEVSGATNSGPVNGSTIYFNGQIVTRFTDSTHPTDAQSSFYVGWDGDDNPFVGDIAEVLVYNRALDGGEIATVNEYLNTKYNQDFAAAAPGGVSTPATTDPKLWLRADAGVTGTSDVSAWADQGPAGRNATSGDGPALVTNSINGNPALSFNGTSDQMSLLGGIFGTDSFNDASVYVIARTDAAQNGTAFSQQLASGSFSAALPNAGDQAQWTTGGNTLGASWGGQTGTPYLWSLLHGTTGTVAGANRAILRNGASVGTDGTAGGFTGASQNFNIGSSFNGDIAEIIVYTSKLTSVEHARVQSYLALKYGITLASQNYVDSEDAIVWNATANAGYNNNIAGIGADEASDLQQLSSRSVDSGVLSVTANAANVTDREFLVWGDDGAALSASTDVPGGYEQRLLRVWRVQEAGDTGVLNSVRFDLTGITGVNLGQSSQFALLTDSDATFSNASVTTGAVRLGNIITFSNVNLGSGDYLSLAYPDVDVSITAPASGATTGGQPTFSGTAEPGSTVEVREGATLICSATTNGSGNWTCNPSSNLSDGPHTVDVTATLSGFSSAAVSRSFTSDATPPSAPVVTNPAASAYVGLQPGFSGTAEPGSTVEVREGASLICSATANGSGNWSCTPSSNLSQGPHTVDVTATDAANNTSPAASRSFTVDTSAPDAPVVTTPSDGALLNVARPTFSGTAEPGSTVEVREGASLVCSATTNGSGNWSCTPSADLGEGAHSVSVTAVDSASNTSPAATRSFSIDTVSPATPVVIAPTAGELVTTVQPTISGTAEPGSTVEVREGASLVCSATTNGSGNWTCTPSSNLSQGLHTVDVTATDAANNTSSAASRSFTVDSDAPAAPVVTSPSQDGELLNVARPTFSGTAEPGSTVEVREGASLICSATANGSGSWSCTPSADLGEGAHAVNVVASDAAGNDSPAATRSFSIDTIAPDAPAISAPEAAEYVGLRPGFSGTAEIGSTVEVREGGTLICSAITAGDGNWTCTPSSDLDQGAHTVSVTATDTHGNASSASSRSFTVDTNAPAAPAVTSPTEGALLTTPRPTFSGTAEANTTIEVLNGATVLCTTTADGGGSWSCTATSDLTDGDHTVSVTATDAAELTSSATNRAFTLDSTAPQAPAVTTPAEDEVLATARPVFSGTAEVGSTVEVRHGATLICQTTAAVDGRWSCVPATDLADGEYTVSVTATDAGDQTSPATSRSFTLDTSEPDVPVVDIGGGQTAGALPTFSGTGEPGTTIEIRDGETLLCTAVVQPDGSWSCTSTVELSEGDHDLTIVARDSAGNVSQVGGFTITVQVEFTVFAPVVGRVTSYDATIDE
jgi:hypothetical protein